MSLTQLENHFHLLRGRYFATEKLLAPPKLFELIIDKIKQNYLNKRDLDPL